MTALVTLARDAIEWREPAVPEAVRVLRAAAAKQLREWQVDESTAGDAAVVISELLTNALRHGKLHPHNDLVLRLAVIGGTLRIEVDDRNFDDWPRPTPPGAVRETGNGMHLVAALAEWGVICVRRKTVYANLALGGRS